MANCSLSNTHDQRRSVYRRGQPDSKGNWLRHEKAEAALSRIGFAGCASRSVVAFTRPGDVSTQTFARRLGAAGAARRRNYLCCRRRPRAPGAESRPQGRSRRLRGHPYERHPQLSLSAALGGAADRLGGQSSAAGWTWISCAWLRRSASSPIPRPIHLTRLIKPSPISAPGGSKARQFSCPDHGQTGFKCSPLFGDCIPFRQHKTSR